jgi:polyisoprenoid-binding protein YceI
MSTAPTTVTVPAGTWDFDRSHTSVNFSVRHMMVSKVRGRFSSFQGTIITTDDPLLCSVTAVIDTASVDTGDEQRDGHLRSPDFLDVEKSPAMTFASTAVRQVGEGEYQVDGNLTIRDTTRPVTLYVTLLGVQKDPQGGIRVGFEASTEFSRKDFGLEWNMALEAGGVVVGDKVKVELEIEAVLQPATA